MKNAREIHLGRITDVSEIGVRAVDNFTVEFTLEYPAAYFPRMVGLPVFRPLPVKCIDTCKDRWTDPENIQSNGPYMLKYWDKGMQMILRKNPTYNDFDKAHIQEIRYLIIPEPSVSLNMYENDDLDILGGWYTGIPPDELPRILADPILSKEHYAVPSFTTYFFVFSTRIPPTDNVLVRKAIAAAIDRRLLIQFVYKGIHQASTTLTPPGIFGAVDPQEGVGISFNPNQAQKWLAEAGYPEGRGIPDIVLPHDKGVYEAVQTFLNHYLNIIARPLKKSESPETEPVMRLIGFAADYPDANSFLNEQLLINTESGGWNNAEFAELTDQVKGVDDPEVRRELYKRAEQILCDKECVVVPLLIEKYHYLVKPRVKRWEPMRKISGQHISEWYFEQ